MLFRSKKLHDYKLLSLDGEIGRVKDFYFDDRHWGVRYIVADTGTWLPGRKVLISPHSVGDVMEDAKDISVRLTKKQIEDSPGIDSDKPVSRQFEEYYYGYYGFPSYWSSPSDPKNHSLSHQTHWNPSLRNTREILGDRIQAKDGEVGHVEDFLIDEKTWTIRYIVATTRHWWLGKKIMISPKWIDRISFDERKVFVNLTTAALKQSKEYREEALAKREHEKKIRKNYEGRKHRADHSQHSKQLR